MPAGQPFTRLCQQLAQPRGYGRADLHLHTTASDGTYAPAQIVDLARRSGLSAIAITDHDTCAGVRAAQQAAHGLLEVCPGVEITSEFRGKELHLLGLFFDPEDAALQRALEDLRAHRVTRFQEMRERLGVLGVRLPAEETDVPAGTTLGRRHLAELLVQHGKAATVRQAFQRYLGDQGRVALPNRRLPVGEAIALVRAAGGVASWAHPAYDGSDDALHELRALGLQALEVDFPACRPGRSRRLRELAGELALAVSAGSDCHGPGEPRRTVGACSLSRDEYQHLRGLAIC